MKIQSINYTPLSCKGIFQKKNEKKDSCSQYTTLPKMGIPSTLAVQMQKEDEFFKAFLTRKGKVTKQEYDEIAKKHPSAIIKAQKLLEQEEPTQSSPKEVALAAKKLKDKYDKEYKNNGYILASIGTSPAAITEVMSALGCNVIFIPASGLNRIPTSKNYIFRNQYPTIASRNQNVQYIVNYARKKGINPSKKEILIMLDYCNTGTSLSNLCDIFIEEKLYTPEKIHDKSILNDLSELSRIKDPNSDFTAENFANIAHDMHYSNAANVSNVPHFHIEDIENKMTSGSISSKDKTKKELFKEFDRYSQPTARAFALCAIHEAMKLSKNN